MKIIKKKKASDLFFLCLFVSFNLLGSSKTNYNCSPLCFSELLKDYLEFYQKEKKRGYSIYFFFFKKKIYCTPALKTRLHHREIKSCPLHQN